MNRYFKIFFAFALCSFFTSCNQDIEKFDNSTNLIYFDLPYKLDITGKPTKERVDSLLYSFALEAGNYTEHTFKVVINTVGLASDIDRELSVNIVESETTATDKHWDKNSVTNCVIKKGSVIDTIYIKLKRDLDLADGEKVITLELKENSNFKLGQPNLIKFRLHFSDILQKPEWWSKRGYSAYVGVEFHREILIKWMEIYYLGADPNVEGISYAPNYEKPLWYGNMPHLGQSLKAYYPSTIMFFGKLRKYFDENDVYPGGDKSKPKIKLPIPV